MSVQELYPKTQVTIGPVIDNGFFIMIFQEKNLLQKMDLKKD